VSHRLAGELTSSAWPSRPWRPLREVASASVRRGSQRNGAHADESSAGRIGRFTTDSPMPVPLRGWEGKAVGELNRQAVMKMNHIQ
jgi:hypothetical protein